jgi:histidyl-tRNA synthetase
MSQPVRPIERVRGTHDLLPDDVREIHALEARLIDRVRCHGYRLTEPPVLEHTELFLRKSGGDRVAQLYAFEHRGRSLALRPEFTASVVRTYIEHLQSEPLPQRLAVCGPVFRYEKPQAGRSRQFTEFGCELIGATGPVADAEVIALALNCLTAAGISRPRLVLGHIGVVVNFLNGLDIDQRAQDWLTWSMERVRKGDDTAHELPPHLARFEASLDEIEGIPAGADDLSAETIAGILRLAGISFEGGVRSPEEVVRGLFARRRRTHNVEMLRDAADFVVELTRLTGTPADVLGPLRERVEQRGLDTQPLDELEQVVDLLTQVGVDPDSIDIDLGMGRGLHYYTGMLFEVYDSERSGLQLCGGGRYDDLAQILGARSTVPACGFSLGLERVIAASGTSAAEPGVPAVLVLQGADPAGAMRLAVAFREAGWSASVDLRGRNESATRRAAQRQGFLAIARATDAGIETTVLLDGTRREHEVVPSPDMVVNR